MLNLTLNETNTNLKGSIYILNNINKNVNTLNNTKKG